MEGKEGMSEMSFKHAWIHPSSEPTRRESISAAVLSFKLVRWAQSKILRRFGAILSPPFASCVFRTAIFERASSSFSSSSFHSLLLQYWLLALASLLCVYIYYYVCDRRTLSQLFPLQRLRGSRLLYLSISL